MFVIRERFYAHPVLRTVILTLSVVILFSFEYYELVALSHLTL